MGKEEMLTTQQIANEYGVAYQTVMAWVYKGFFPNAQKEETPRGPYYLVPRSDLRDFKAPKRGRPPKAEGEGAENAAAPASGRAKKRAVAANEAAPTKPKAKLVKKTQKGGAQ